MAAGQHRPAANPLIRTAPLAQAMSHRFAVTGGFPVSHIQSTVVS
jgi:hypothetical protein